jgi:hypothetical protein
MTILTHPSNDRCKFAPRNDELNFISEITNVTFFFAMVIGLDKKRVARRNSPPSQTAL